ncbi:MAG TPA: chloride channel protein [Phenylobacterium sp.]|nr:chloride channel protein [Phenylobacterium sp.]HQN51404.1 chloride channel protein [Phenylobacterium sp.]
MVQVSTARSVSLPLRGLAFARRQIRSSELWLIAVAVLAGAAAGGLAVVQAKLAHGLQILLFAFDPDQRLSAQAAITPWRVLFIPAGGLALGLMTWAWSRWRTTRAVDPVEANALHGGAMSVRDSAFICAQTLVSNGSGASVGLEAAYAQAGGAAGSMIGRALALRRADLRTLVGAGAGAAIAAAFGAPLTGAFYAFEIVIGAYTVANIAPVAAAALAAVLVARSLGGDTYKLSSTVEAIQNWPVYGLYALLGLATAVFGVALMRMVATAERWTVKLPVPLWLRPALGGMLLAGIALYTPQTLSAGHGALALDLERDLGLKMLLLLIAMKAAASIISLSFGFRGGLFFAALFLGALEGQAFAELINLAPGLPHLNGTVAALVGMGALGVAIIGGPLTMSFLVLETTGDFSVTAATLVASLIASAVVRETFGYSFSTWRLHLRGETIRSAHDVGWIRTLTAGRMMRKDVPAVPTDTGLAEFRRRFPLGAAKRVVLTDAEGRYAGLAPVAAAWSADLNDSGGEGDLAALAVNAQAVLAPEMSIKEIMAAFDRAQSDELAVVDAEGQVLGVLTEAYATRRYAEELEKARRDLTGEA